MSARSMRDGHSLNMKSHSDMRNGIVSKRGWSKTRNGIVYLLLLLLPGLVDAQFQIRSPVRSFPSTTLRLSRPSILSTGSGNLQAFSDLAFQQSRGFVRTSGRTSGFGTVQREIRPIGTPGRLIRLSSSVQRIPSPPLQFRIVQRARQVNPALSPVIPSSFRSGTRDVFPAATGTQPVRRIGAITSSGTANVPLVSNAGREGIPLQGTGTEIQTSNTVARLQARTPTAGIQSQTISVGQQQHTVGAGTLQHINEAGIHSQAISVGTQPRVDDVGTQPIVSQTGVQSAVITADTQPVGSPQPDAFHQELVDVFTNVIEGILAPQSAVAQPTNQHVVPIGPSASIHQHAFQPFFPTNPYDPYAHFRSMNPWELPAMMQEMWYGDTQDPPDGITTTSAPAKTSTTVKPLTPIVTTGPALTVDTVAKAAVDVKPSSPIDTKAPAEAVVKAAVGIKSSTPIDTKVPADGVSKTSSTVPDAALINKTKPLLGAVEVAKEELVVKQANPSVTTGPVLLADAVAKEALGVKPSTPIDTTGPVLGAGLEVKATVAVKPSPPSDTTGSVLVAAAVVDVSSLTKDAAPSNMTVPVLGADHITDHVTDHVIDHVTDHVIGHVIDHVVKSDVVESKTGVEAAVKEVSLTHTASAINGIQDAVNNI